MRDTSARADNLQQPLAIEPVPADSRHARQIARRQLMARAVVAEGTMRIEDLTERFGISLMTAHRDLDELVDKGILRKTRGVVSASRTGLVDTSESHRAGSQAEEKAAIAQVAAACLEPGQTAFLDDSTTVLHLVPHLATRVPLTVVTNSLTLMNGMKGARDVTLLGLGGQFHDWCNAFMGPATTAEIRRMRTDCAFLSMSAIADDMVFHQSPETVETKRAMFDSAAQRILLADHTKFGRRALYAMGRLDEFDVVIVDDGISPSHVERMKAKGITVVVAPVPRSGSTAQG